MLVNGVRLQKSRPTPLSLNKPTELQLLPGDKVFYFHNKLPKRVNPVLGTVQDTQEVYKLTGNINWPQPNSRRHLERLKTNGDSDEGEDEDMHSILIDEYSDGKSTESTGSCDSYDDEDGEYICEQGIVIIDA